MIQQSHAEAPIALNEQSLPSESSPDSTAINVGHLERGLSAIAGGAIVFHGLNRGGLRGACMALLGSALVYRGLSGHCPAYASLDINTANNAPPPPEAYFEKGIHIEQSITVAAEPAALYAVWRKLENLPRFMQHLESVTMLDDTHSHWVAVSPVGVNIEWDAEIINDEPNSLIAWRSLGGAAVDNAGSVRFLPAPEGRATEVKLVLDYIAPAGKLGEAVGRWLNFATSSYVREDLRRFKQIIEAAPAVPN